jgi:uroporphyrinogen decarboxylase
MELLLKALGCKNEGRPPVWFMRQAGRYLPQYRTLKEGRSLFEMFHNRDAVVEVTLLPVEVLGVDAAILFSDILTVLEGLNIRYDFQEGIGPLVLDPPDSLCSVDPEEVYGHITASIRTLKQELKVPLLGFAGAPFTIASYIIEGKTSRDLKKTKRWLFRNPESFQRMLDKITEATIGYLNCQIDAGVDAVQLFDSWANALGIEEFRVYCLKPMRKIIDAVKKRGVPIILFCRGSCLFVKELVSISPSAISLDWSGDLFEMRKQIPPSIAVQGNLDPMALYASQEHLRERVDCLLNRMRNDRGYIFNLGHGLLPDTPVDNVQFLVDYVRNRFETFVEAR